MVDRRALAALLCCRLAAFLVGFPTPLAVASVHEPYPFLDIAAAAEQSPPGRLDAEHCGRMPVDDYAGFAECYDSGCAANGCDACCDAGCDDRLFGIIAPSDCCFRDFVSPITNTLYFEDPRTLSEVRIIFAHHKIPGSTLGGGSGQCYAAQVRAALTDRLSIIATKDGYFNIDTGALGNVDGFANIAGGLKYNLWADFENQQLISVGGTYEAPTGSRQVFQGEGDGDFHLFLTGGTQLGCHMHWLSAGGWRLPADPTAGSQLVYWSNHLDYRLSQRLYAVAEAHWFHWARSGGNAATAGLEGNDLFDLGSTGVAGKDIVTGAIGLRYKFCDHRILGIAYEGPLTNERDLMESRITADFILRY